MGSPGHRSVAIFPGQVRQDAAQFSNLRLNERKTFADLQYDRSIHDVLSGRPPMDVAASIAALLDELVHQGEERDNRRCLSPGVKGRSRAMQHSISRQSAPLLLRG